MTIFAIDVNQLLILLLPLLHMSITHAMEPSTSSNYASMFSKRHFLSPKDLQGFYSRFLEVSENSTICPNTIVQHTNGILRPSGYIHIPLRDISQDGQRCDGPGELILRFRRRMTSSEIEQHFNITANATGIDKMVRDTLLALDAFYFGRQTTEITCHASDLPSNATFFFTSQSKPFAANVGVPFHQNPKIMFIVDKTRVCAFSGTFMQSQPTEKENQLIPEISITPMPRTTLIPDKTAKSSVDKSEAESPRHPKGILPENEELLTHQPKVNDSKAMARASRSPSTSPKALGPSISYKETDALPEETKSSQFAEQNMISSTPLPTARSGPDDNRNDNTNQHHEIKLGQLEDNMVPSSPSPSQLPRNPSPRPMSFPEKNFSKKGAPGNPSRSLTAYPSQKETLLSTSSSSPIVTNYEFMFPSVSPKKNAHSAPSTIAPTPHFHTIEFTTDDLASSPPPLHDIDGEGNQSDSHSQGNSFNSGPLMNATVLPEPSVWEVIIGDSESTCFPSSATVVLKNGRLKRMNQLSVGVSVSVGNGKSSKIIDFSHFDETIVSTFLQLQTDSGKNLTLTPSHFVYTDYGLIPAANVILGDYLKLSDGRPTRVLSISRVQSQGLFNPHTLHGDIVVNGFILSTYTLAVAPMTAHALLAPIRLLYDLGFRISIVSKLSKQPTILKTCRSLLSSNINPKMFKKIVNPNKADQQNRHR